MKLEARWTHDCQGKQDYDANLVTLSTRYWPRGGGFLLTAGGRFQENRDRPDIRPAARASILMQGVEIAHFDVEAETEAEVKALVEKWAQSQFDRIAALVAELRAALKEHSDASDP